VVVDPLETKKLEAEVRAAMEREGVNVIVARRACVLLERGKKRAAIEVDEDKCKVCGVCLSTGCQAITKGETSVTIDARLCAGCGLCVDICPLGALRKKE